MSERNHLPTEWEPCPELDGIEIKLDSGQLMFRLAGCQRSHIVAWWVKVPGVRASTAVKAVGERGGTHKLGSARTLPEASRLVARHLGRKS
jgi:hypothetical protein